MLTAMARAGTSTIPAAGALEYDLIPTKGFCILASYTFDTGYDFVRAVKTTRDALVSY
jgi:hypothetical protein